MQISGNYRANQAFLQIKLTAKYVLVFILLLGVLSCSQSTFKSVDSVSRILPVADSPDLPAVIQSLISQSDEQYQNHNFSGSLATLERAVRINPRYAEVWSRMAQIYLKLGNLDQAKQHAKRSNSVIKNNLQLKMFNDKIINKLSVESVN